MKSSNRITAQVCVLQIIKTQMKGKVLQRTFISTALLFSVVGLVICSSAVEEAISFYSCCDQIVKFDPSCVNIWKMDDENFAYTSHRNKECIAPCKAIEDGRMTLDSCLNVTVITVCTTTMGTATETRNTYLGHECPHPLFSRTSPAQGSVDLLLPAVIWMISVLN